MFNISMGLGKRIQADYFHVFWKLFYTETGKKKHVLCFFHDYTLLVKWLLKNRELGTFKWHVTCQHSWHLLSRIFPTALVVAFLKGATRNWNDDGCNDEGYNNNELCSSMVGQQGIYFLLLSPRFIKECRSVAKECSVVSEEKPTDPNWHII